MIPASISQIKLLLRRITFICCASMMLACTGCFDTGIPDQDANINIYADEPSSSEMIKLDTSAAYDTIASTLTCLLHFDSANTHPQDMPVVLYGNHKEIKSVKSVHGKAELGWLTEGEYALVIGNPGEYPCYNIYNMHIPSGRNCVLHVYKIPKS